MQYMTAYGSRSGIDREALLLGIEYLMQIRPIADDVLNGVELKLAYPKGKAKPVETVPPIPVTTMAMPLPVGSLSQAVEPSTAAEAAPIVESTLVVEPVELDEDTELDARMSKAMEGW
ncbi:hypothetical protein [Vibrio harveyi]|uniref:hypothetical protein n=1 Tax=Vibrio harveyi TaxID=669 RepID=UPI003909304F